MSEPVAAGTEAAEPTVHPPPTGGRPPKVTVGLPVYNGEKYVDQAIESVLGQTYEDFELVISDNASTDRTEEICRTYADRDPRVRYVRLERNIGGSPNHNRVFELARGEYFMWIGHDDTRSPEYLERCVAPLEADPSLAICYSQTKYIDENGDPLDYREVELDVGSEDPLVRFRELIRADHQIEPQLGLIRSEFLRRTVLEGPYADSDRVLLAELGLHGRFHRVPEELFHRRDHAERLTRSGPRQERTAWFNPDAPDSIVFPYYRQLREYVASIRRAAPSGRVRRACYRMIAGWAWQNRRVLVSDLRWGAVLTARRLGYRGRHRRAFQKPTRIGIWGHYNGGNLGDELVVRSMIENVRERLPNAEIVGFSLGPRNTSREHKIPAHPLRRGEWEMDSVAEQGGSRLESALAEIGFLRRARKNLKGTHLLAVAGSGPLSDDWRGPWSHPYAVYKWSLLAKTTRTRFVIPSVGAGPIDHRLTRTFLKRGVRRSVYTSFRDQTSADVIRGLGIEGELPVVPDMAFGLSVEAYKGRSEGLVGFNPLPFMRVGAWYPADEVTYRSYVNRAATFLEHVLENHRVLLIYTDLQGDVPVGADLRQELYKRDREDLAVRLLEPNIKGVEGLLQSLGRCDVMVAGRYHGILVPALMEIPTVALAYHHKTRDLMQMFGLPEYCLDVADFRPEQLIERFEALLENAEAVREKQRRAVPPLTAQVSEQFDRLTALARLT